MKTIKLYGALRKFGREFRFDVKSPAEAIKALMTQVPGFKQHLAEHSAPGYRVWAGDDLRDISKITIPCSNKEIIRIVPIVGGSGSNGGLFGIILGIGLIAIGGPAGWLANTLLMETSTAFFTATAIGTAATSIGWGLVLGGISSLLFKPPKTNTTDTERPENKPSYIFNGAVNTTAQGQAVPICYGGPIRVGSHVISAGLYVEQIAA